MEWLIFFILSTACLAVSLISAAVYGKMRYRRGRILDTSKILFMGVVVSSVLLFVPIYYNLLGRENCGVLESVLISIHNMIRLFVVDGEFEFITSNLSGIPPWIHKAYTIIFSILFVLAPMLTFGFVLSFFKNISAYNQYLFNYNSDVFIFSELNEKSLVLAESLLSGSKKKSLAVFTDVYITENETTAEYFEHAKELGAVCFKKDITAINLKLHNKNSTINLFTLNENQSENIICSLKLIEKLKDRENTNLYVFSTEVESELLLAKAFSDSGEDSKIKVRRINEVQSLISRTLYETGYEKIFCSAVDNGSGKKQINALIIGMGQHGTEMTKALSWFCQMYGYEVHINSFDIDDSAADKFCSLCPELMKEELNGNFTEYGESQYEIKIHSGIDAETKTFDSLAESVSNVSYVFVALGNDEKNIMTAIKIRTLFARQGIYPVIQAVVYNTDKKDALKDISNFKNQKYDIDFIGDIKSAYSSEVILDSDVEKEALARHLKWGAERDFWQYDYNRKSSVASAIHCKMKKLCGIPGIDKKPCDRTEKELWDLRILEHRRWNAYMRSEGYVFGGTVKPEGRNDLAKMHNCLVPFDELSEKDKIKDDD